MRDSRGEGLRETRWRYGVCVSAVLTEITAACAPDLPPLCKAAFERRFATAMRGRAMVVVQRHSPRFGHSLVLLASDEEWPLARQSPDQVELARACKSLKC